MCTSRAAGVASVAGGASSQGGPVDSKVVSDFVFAGVDCGTLGQRTADDELDFLDGGPPAPGARGDRLQPDHPRHAEANRLATVLAGDPETAADVWRTAATDPRLGRADGDGLWVLCAAALAVGQCTDDAPTVPPTGVDAAVATLAAAALQAGDGEIAWQGARLTALGRLAALQSPLAEALARHVLVWDRDRRAEVLRFLEAHGDGRCVRPLEALLAESGAALDDAQAYKARHIVQIIRRGRRK